MYNSKRPYIASMHYRWIIICEKLYTIHIQGVLQQFQARTLVKKRFLQLIFKSFNQRSYYIAHSVCPSLQGDPQILFFFNNDYNCLKIHLKMFQQTHLWSCKCLIAHCFLSYGIGFYQQQSYFIRGEKVLPHLRRL